MRCYGHIDLGGEMEEAWSVVSEELGIEYGPSLLPAMCLNPKQKKNLFYDKTIYNGDNPSKETQVDDSVAFRTKGGIIERGI